MFFSLRRRVRWHEVKWEYERERARIDARYNRARSEAERKAVTEEQTDMIRSAFRRAQAWAGRAPE